MSRPVHFEIPAEDLKRATTFFSNVFGWTFQGWGDGSYQICRTGDDPEMGINGAVLTRRDPGQPVVNSITVASIEDAAAKIEANGGKMVVPKQSITGMGYNAYFKDTEGNIHGLWQLDPNAP